MYPPRKKRDRKSDRDRMSGKELRKRRERLGLSQPKLAQALGDVSQQSISAWEREAWPVPGWMDLALTELERRRDQALGVTKEHRQGVRRKVDRNEEDG